MATITAQGVASVNAKGVLTYGVNPDTPRWPASSIKVFTAYIVRRHLPLAQLVTVASADAPLPGSSANLKAGDVLTVEDLLHGLMLPSGNDAAHTLARATGTHLLNGDSGDPLLRFRDEMTAVAADFGWEGAVFHSPSGDDQIGLITPRQMCELMLHIDATDPALVHIMGTRTRLMTATGPNARTWTVTHSINPDGGIKFPEYIAGKTGTFDASYACVTILWAQPDGSRHATTLLASTVAARYNDLVAVLDAAVGPPGFPLGGAAESFILLLGYPYPVVSGVVLDGAFRPLSPA